MSANSRDSSSAPPVLAPTAVPEVQTFSIAVPWIQKSDGMRLDASFYNRRVAEALNVLRRSGLSLARLGDPSLTERIFIPQRFRRVYVRKQYGVPFLQGSHLVHMEPADLKYISTAVHRAKLAQLLIKKGWVLVTRSGTIGRVALALDSWDGWAASEHILRIVPASGGPCPAGYIAAFLGSELGQAQLTSSIYGAVVDEITPDHAGEILIPIPTTADEVAAVAEINESSRKAAALKAEAIARAALSVEQVMDFVPGANSGSATHEDRIDASIAAERLQEACDNPEALVSGKALERRLARLRE